MHDRIKTYHDMKYFSESWKWWLTGCFLPVECNLVLRLLCRFETLEPEMNNLGSRITDVNQVAEQLLKSDNRNKEQINQTQDQLNDRYTHTTACEHIALFFKTGSL